MKKYCVFGELSIIKVIGHYDAITPEEAIKKAEVDDVAEWCVGLCWERLGKAVFPGTYDELLSFDVIKVEEA